MFTPLAVSYWRITRRSHINTAVRKRNKKTVEVRQSTSVRLSNGRSGLE
jgi:hypothetical protein